MDSIETAIYLIAGVLITSGILTLGVGLFATEMLLHPTVRLLTIGMRSAPTRTSAVMQGLWFLMLGVCFILSNSKILDISPAVFASVIPLAYIALKRGPWKQEEGKEDKEDAA